MNPIYTLSGQRNANSGSHLLLDGPQGALGAAGVGTFETAGVGTFETQAETQAGCAEGAVVGPRALQLERRRWAHEAMRLYRQPPRDDRRPRDDGQLQVPIRVPPGVVAPVDRRAVP